MGKLDTLGRATFHHIASQDAVCPTNREIRWLKHIERHGPQSSVYLYELTKNTHRCKDTALRDMQKLRAGGYLCLPPQQRATERAEFNPYIYDLTIQAKRWLADHGLAEPTVRPTGHWWHGYAVSCVSSALDIAAARDGVRYIPAHKILARKGETLGIPVNGKLLIPDQLFALDYGGSYRAFLLEVDRGTEPVSSKAARKSYASSIAQYAEVLWHGLHRDHYGLKANLLVLWVFASHSRMHQFLDISRGLPTNISGRMLVHKVEVKQLRVRPGEIPTNLFSTGWQTASGSLMSITS
jgi:hypothetical protein